MSKINSNKNAREYFMPDLELKLEQNMKLLFHDHINKCRCCFTYSQNKNENVLINEMHRKIFQLVLNVDLKINSNFSDYLCRSCNEKLLKLSEFVHTFGEVQTKIYKSVDDENSTVSESFALQEEPATLQHFVGAVSSHDNLIDIVKIEKEQILVEQIGLPSYYMDFNLKECSVRLERVSVNSVDGTSLMKLNVDSQNSTVVNSDEKEFERLKKQHPVVKPFKCPDKTCRMVFTFKSSMEKHFLKHKKVTLKLPSKSKKLESVLKLEKTLSCDMCDYTTIYKWSLQNHFTRHHIATKVECKLCHKFFIGEQQLKVHQKIHKNVKHHTCEICGDNFKEYQSLQSHVIKYHNSMKSQMKCTCDICGLEYYSRHHMDKHMKQKHVGSFKCFFKECTKRFTEFYNRRKHFLCFHNNDVEEVRRLEKKEPAPRPHKCLEKNCNRRFSGKTYLIKHQLSHSKDHLAKKSQITNTTKSKISPKKLITCDICGHSATFKANLSCHMNTKHVTKESKCQLCKKVFKNEARMKDHLRKTHRKKGNDGDFDCPICKTLLSCYVSLRGHVDTLHPLDKTKITCICDVCGIGYYSKPYLEHHMRIEHNRPFKCFDAKCSKRFVNVTNRKIHYLSFHSRDLEEYKRLQRKAIRPFKCIVESCKKRFRGDKAVMKHYHSHFRLTRKEKRQLLPRKLKKSKHTTYFDKHFHCDLCDFKTTTKGSLSNHMKQKHKHEESKCHKCGKLFPNISKLKIHVSRMHSKVKNFDCSICLRKFREYEQLRSHVERIHFKNRMKMMHNCDTCGVNSYSKFHLEKHLIREHSRPFKCLDIKCTKMFVSASSRRMHFLSIHNNILEEWERLELKDPVIRPYKCLDKTCEKKFKSMSSMRFHHKSHIAIN